MTRDLRRQAAKRGREHVGERDYRQQSASDFAARMTRPRKEMLNEKRHDEQKRQYDAAEPPGDGSPKKAQGRVRKKLKKEDAGGRQNSAGKKKSRAENQRNAVLSSLEANEGNGGKNKGEKTADDLQVALKNGIGLQLDSAKPVSGENDKKEDGEMRQKDPGVGATACERGFTHGVAELSSILRAGLLLN